MSSINPSMARVIRRAIDQALKQMHVGLPAKVVSFDAQRRTCVVQPLLRRVVIEDGAEREESYPQIPGIPVWYPGGSGYHLRWPLRKDDVVWLSFADRAIETWKAADEGKEVDPAESRMHDLKDCIAFAVMRPPSSLHPVIVDDSMVLGNEDGSTEIVLGPAGITIKADTIKIGDNATEAMVLGTTLLQKLTLLESALKLHTHPTSVGESLVSTGLATPFIDSSILSQTETVK